MIRSTASGYAEKRMQRYEIFTEYENLSLFFYKKNRIFDSFRQ